MPVTSRIFPQPPGGLGPASLQQQGPTINLQVLIPSALEQQLRQSGQPVPPPISGVGLVDTGATISAVDDTVIQRLGISPIGLTTTGTAGGPAQQNLYPARFAFPDLLSGFEFSRVLGANLTGLGIIALVGRDVLSRMILVYNGPVGVVTLGI